jgi:putative ABC transport system permease protein
VHDIALSLARCIRPGGMIHLTETTLPPDEVMFNPTLGWNAFVIPVIVIAGLTAILGALINRRRKRVDMLEALKSVD